jgi:D-3-phosphoglycerate dehydrogenase
VKPGLAPGALKAIIGDYNGLVVRSATKVTADILEAAKGLEVIGRAGIGVDNVDVEAASRHGVIVMNTPEGSAVTTAEHAIALLLSLARRIPQATSSMKAGKWDKKRFMGTEMAGKTLGIIGIGNIGGIVADRARGLKMSVVACDPYMSAEVAAQRGITLVGLDELYATADFIRSIRPSRRTRSTCWTPRPSRR